MVRKGEGFKVEDVQNSEEAVQIVRVRRRLGTMHPSGSSREPCTKERKNGRGGCFQASGKLQSGTAYMHASR